jgi:hypothetical protein
MDAPPRPPSASLRPLVRNDLAATARPARRAASSLQPRRVGPFFLFSVLQLGTQIARSEYRPPFTLGVIVAQTLSYLRPGWLKAFLRAGRPVRRDRLARSCPPPTLSVAGRAASGPVSRAKPRWRCHRRYQTST